MNKPMTDEERVSDNAFSVGETLKQQRLNNGWSVEDVADALNLTEHTVSALESDDYSELPGSTFTRGYLRSYASLLGLDGTELTQHIPNDDEHIGHIPTSRSVLKRKGKLMPRRRKKSFVFKWLIILLIAAAAISFLTNFFSGMDRNELAEQLKMPFLKVEENQTNVVEKAKDSSSEILSLFGSTVDKETDNSESAKENQQDTQSIELRFE